MKATVSRAGRLCTKAVDKEEHGMEEYAAPVWSSDSAADERPQRKHLIWHFHWEGAMNTLFPPCYFPTTSQGVVMEQTLTFSQWPEME